jgi:hypothetical protein
LASREALIETSSHDRDGAGRGKPSPDLLAKNPQLGI